MATVLQCSTRTREKLCYGLLHFHFISNHNERDEFSFLVNDCHLDVSPVTILVSLRAP